MTKLESRNFRFMQAHEPQFDRLGALAERNFRDDPNTCLLKLRQFAELLAQEVAARIGLYCSTDESQADLLRRLKVERAVPTAALDLFHQVRKAGNDAAHNHADDHALALTTLKITRQLAIWFHKTFENDPTFKAGPFVPPSEPAAAEARLLEELERLQKQLVESKSAEERAREEAEAAALARETAEERARREAEERATWAELAEEAETAKNALAEQLRSLQAAAEQATGAQKLHFLQLAEAAAEGITLDEAATRAIIDQQLRDRGWEADSEALHFARGTRPSKGRSMAIAEWPTENGPADYALFIDTKLVAVVEAKRRRKNVSAAIDQAERYAKACRLDGGAEPVGGPWGDYRAPFVFATNGRPYLKQLETESGIWFRDTRRNTNTRRALTDWFTPEGLKAELETDREAAQEALKTQPFNFGFPLRPYQRAAIEKVEEALGEGKRELLVAMATGTGKTKLTIALLYRLLNVKRFRRVCFVVDRTALGDQTAGEFRTTKVIGPRAFADIFDLKDLGDAVPETETKVHICTIQGLVNRVLFANEPGTVPPIDQYDLIVVDECHRGYLLDREMSDDELSFRSETDYISKYRRVLEHFDAVKIGLTATPALHTVEIFGDPVFTYSYREAVIDGFLIDHEPPIRIETALAQAGITFGAGEEVEILHTKTGEIDLAHLPDEISFEVESFNRKVITVPFNRTVAEELAKHIDPGLDGKTLVFAATDAHADIVVDELKKAFAAAYGEIEDGAVRKITGSVDRVGSLIRHYRNDSQPKVAVTVDLLTTGIDVPSITSLVFLRRVNSRILYEQMLGRATRQCPDIGKETFRIFDAVDLYPHLQNLTDMRPVVTDPKVALEELFEELTKAEAEEHRQSVLDQIVVKLRRRLRRMHDEARQRYEATTGEKPEDTLKRFQEGTAESAREWVKSKPRGFAKILDWNPDGSGGLHLPISHHDDEVVAVTRGYGDAEKPEDFLDGFTAFVRGNINKIAALNLVVQRPRELTREQLRELRLELDRLGYSEANLKRAWQDAKNEDIAASIIGFVRQAAIGDPLVPFAERVNKAMQRIYASRPWTDPQRKWLKRIAEQVEREIVVDREALDRDPFDNHGGFNRLNKVFGGQLEGIISDINEELWRKTA
ncbi:type I restriction-modification system endonuclease [Limibaculum sp. M0105]|uniref:Type I restriction-modification system endonuclease n=1 Tax=Thermohalobaculum xanthum TaxID=2753746 RepID=A0A8J7SGS1_9RHOB|nr:type I restriction-modification system endonuclease [Thermohalobaculum xanthum]MBK0401218.1 type I restriction-modification system endonuclease [Thermohalobaculum xanthum]